MKKFVTVLSVIAATAFISSIAFAWSGGGRGNGEMHYTRTTTDRQAYYDNTVAIRAAITADNAELNAVLAKDKPDEARVKTLTQDLVKQRDELRKQAEKYNVHGMGMMAQGMGYDGHCPMMD
jgi:Spy/CpxP family protein refolding chaperone